MVRNRADSRLDSLGFALAVAALLLTGAAVASEHVVQPGETLTSVAIAHQAAYPKATLRQIIWGLIRTNPEAFTKGPGKLSRGTRLMLPSVSTVMDTPAADAEQSVKLFFKKPADVAATPAPVPAPEAPPAPPVVAKLPPPNPLPVIAGVELQAAMGTEVSQWFAVSGSAFLPGAKLEFFDLAAGRGFPPRLPARSSPRRLEYQMRFPEAASRWLVRVVNPDGQLSDAFEFDAGRHVTVVLTPAAVAQGAPFRESPEAKSLSAVPAERYQQLASLEDRYAGDVDYDYGYGAAAVDTGNFSQAVFPLQRAVATRPDFAGARLELARAYFGVGDNETARREFTSLRQDRPPPKVEEMIQQYMDAIDRRAIEYQRQTSAYAEFSAGHDSNANGATDSQVFLGFNLNDRSQATASPYYGLNAGGLYSYPIAPGWRTQADAQLVTRQVPDASFVDSSLARGAAALEWRNATFTVNGALSYAYAELDGAENNRNTALDLNASMPLGDNSHLGLGARRAELRFVDSLSNQNTNTNLFSLAVSTAAGETLWSGGLTAGRDQAQAQGSPFGRDLQGARLSAFRGLGNSRYLSGSLAALRSDYVGDFGTGTPRDDTQYSAQIGYEWRDFPVHLWGIKSQLTYVDNRSNIVLFDYDRFDIGVAVRREFR